MTDGRALKVIGTLFDEEKFDEEKLDDYSVATIPTGLFASLSISDAN